MHAREELLIVILHRDNKPKRPIRRGLQALKNCNPIKLNSELAPTPLISILNILNKIRNLRKEDYTNPNI